MGSVQGQDEREKERGGQSVKVKERGGQSVRKKERESHQSAAVSVKMKERGGQSVREKERESQSAAVSVKEKERGGQSAREKERVNQRAREKVQKSQSAMVGAWVGRDRLRPTHLRATLTRLLDREREEWQPTVSTYATHSQVCNESLCFVYY
ncbi:hypothetical protein Pcinc_042539 [Petrolisthes cinctipes]|uniref:Uncharacterized protein n=1 Tax=Petrolisthes cinctipes TaxID=88211 RepID=A0AAE1BHK1_PETCI|nr:hypothetical protein Pcinc_042539 [Petrolisthes cinctipes]